MRLWMVVFIMLVFTGTASASITTYSWSFDASNQSWTNSTTVISSASAGGVVMLWNGSDGNPPGSLNVSLTSNTNGATRTEWTMWKSPNFSWNNGTPVSANLSFDFKVAVYNPNGATGTNNFSAYLVKPDGSVVLINLTTMSSTKNTPNPFPSWTRFNFTIGTNNFTSGGNFSLMLNASLSAKSTGSGNILIGVGWDNPTITVVTSSPIITAFAPASPVNETTGASRTFSITANQIVNVTWYINGTSVQTNTSTVSASYTNTSAAPGVWNVSAVASNPNGTVSKQWLWNVSAPLETIDVTLSNVPVNFSNVLAGSLNQSALLPLIVTIQNTTNVNVNLTLNGSSFAAGTYSFGVGNMTYSNSSTGAKTSMTASFPLPPYADWINIAQLVTTNRSIYLWISIPPGQPAGAYSSTINVLVEKYS
jgi:hypothetical protein